MPIQTALIGESITANVANKCFRANRVIQDVLGAICQAAENLSAVLAWIWSVVIVVVHMFP